MEEEDTHLARWTNAARLAVFLQALSFWPQIGAGVWTGVGTIVVDLGPRAFWEGRAEDG